MKTVIESKEIGQAFKQARLRLILSRRDLAPHMGISRKEIMRYENGSQVIPKETLVKLLEAGIFMHVWGKKFVEPINND